MKIAGSGRTRSKPGWRGRRALRSAQLLDDVVNAQVRLIPNLSPGARESSAEYLAELVMLGQAYRHYAVGWISKCELERRGHETLHRLESLKEVAVQQLTEYE